jgi:lipopolysaccharide assembly outer membrane protein LptD (OstA)
MDVISNTFYVQLDITIGLHMEVFIYSYWAMNTLQRVLNVNSIQKLVILAVNLKTFLVFTRDYCVCKIISILQTFSSHFQSTLQHNKDFSSLFPPYD